MKLSIFLMLVFAILTGCDSKTASQPGNQSKEGIAVAPAIAPLGVYFLTTAVSVETADGIIGIQPGTTVMKQADGSFLAGTQKLKLKEGQFTNDMQVAARVAGADAAAQAALQRATQATAAANRAAAAASHARRKEVAAQSPGASFDAPVSVPAPATEAAPTTNALDQEAYGQTQAFRNRSGSRRVR